MRQRIIFQSHKCKAKPWRLSEKGRFFLQKYINVSLQDLFITFALLFIINFSTDERIHQELTLLS